MSGNNLPEQGGGSGARRDNPDEYDPESLWVQDELEKVGNYGTSVNIAGIPIPGATEVTFKGEGRESSYLVESDAPGGSSGYNADVNLDEIQGDDSEGGEGSDTGSSGTERGGEEPPLNITIECHLGHQTGENLAELREQNSTFGVTVFGLQFDDMEMTDFTRGVSGEHPYTYDATVEVQEWREYEVQNLEDYLTTDNYGTGTSFEFPDEDTEQWGESGSPTDPTIFELEEDQTETFEVDSKRVRYVMFDQSASGADATLQMSGGWTIENVGFIGDGNGEPNIVTTGGGIVSNVYSEGGGIKHDQPGQVTHNSVRVQTANDGVVAPEAGLGYSVGGNVNTGDVAPDIVQTIQDTKPDPASAYNVVEGGGWEGPDGDLAGLVRSASAEDDAIVVLDGGRYEIGSSVSTSLFNAGDVVGIKGNGATIEYHGGDVEYAFNIGTPGDMALEGVTFELDQNSSQHPDGIADMGIINADVGGNFWAEDVSVSGKRKRWQSLEAQGGYFTWLVNMTSPDGLGLSRNIDLSDGALHGESAGRKLHHAQGIGFSADPPHVGTNLFENCTIQNWPSNGYYIQNNDGVNILLNCHARSCASGGMRPGKNDIVINGLSESYSNQAGLQTQPLAHAEGRAEVHGLQIESTLFGGNAIQVRKEAQSLLLDRVSLNLNYENRPVRFSASAGQPGVNVEIHGGQWVDHYDGDAGRATCVIRNADVSIPSGDLAVSTNRDLFYVDSGRLTVGDTEYDPGTYTREDVGLPEAGDISPPSP